MELVQQFFGGGRGGGRWGVDSNFDLRGFIVAPSISPMESIRLPASGNLGPCLSTNKP